MGQGVQSRSAPLLTRGSCSSTEGVSPILGSAAPSAAQVQLDAADTVHVLLKNQMMWDPSSHPGAAPLPQPVGGCERADPCDPCVSQISSGTGPGSSSFTRVVPRHAAEAPLITPFRDVQRASDDGTAAVCRSPGSSNPGKRTRSGLSQRLPSLVELPGAEARCALQDSGVELDCASARDSLDGTIHAHTSVSLPSRGPLPTTDSAAARPVAGGLSGYSSSSPGAAASLQDTGAAVGAEEPLLQPGIVISTALARLQYAAPALARVRATVTRAASGTQPAHGQAAAAAPWPGTGPSEAVVSGTGRTSEEQKQRGSESVMQLLQTSNDHDRERWRSRLLNRKASCTGLLRASNGSIATHICAA